MFSKNKIEMTVELIDVQILLFFFRIFLLVYYLIKDFTELIIHSPPERIKIRPFLYFDPPTLLRPVLLDQSEIQI